MSHEFTVPFYGWVNEGWIWAVLSVFLLLCVTWPVPDIKSSGKFPHVFCVAGSSGCAAWFRRGQWNTCWQQLKGTVFTGHPNWSHPRKHQLFVLLKALERFWNRGALAAVPNWLLSEAVLPSPGCLGYDVEIWGARQSEFQQSHDSHEPLLKL